MIKSFSYIGKTVNYFTTSDNLYFKVVDISPIIGVSGTTIRKMRDYQCLCDGELIKVDVDKRDTNFISLAGLLRVITKKKCNAGVFLLKLFDVILPSIFPNYSSIKMEELSPWEESWEEFDPCDFSTVTDVMKDYAERQIVKRGIKEEGCVTEQDIYLFLTQA